MYTNSIKRQLIILTLVFISQLILTTPHAYANNISDCSIDEDCRLEHECRIDSLANVSSSGAGGHPTNKFTQIRLANKCKLRICYDMDRKFDICENYVSNYAFMEARTMPDSRKCTCNEPNSLLNVYRDTNTNPTPTQTTQATDEQLVSRVIRMGKGTLRFAMKPAAAHTHACHVYVGALHFQITARDINLVSPEWSHAFTKEQVRTPTLDLLHFNASDLNMWISVHGTSQDRAFNRTYFVKFGYGYVARANLLVVFRPGSDAVGHLVSTVKNVTLAVESGRLVEAVHVSAASFTRDKSPLVKRDLTKADIEAGVPTPDSLPREAQSLYAIIHNFELSGDETDAINYSLEHAGCLLSEKLGAKLSFSQRVSTTSYLRVTVEYFDIDAPGSALVLEIWPRAHSSPIHNHGDCVAVIKVLHGEIVSEYYNPLPVFGYEAPMRIGVCSLKAGQLTWMTPDAYQTHRLFNPRNDTAAITLQAYAHVSSSEREHDEKFNYVVDDDPHLKHFYPKSDFFFKDMMQRVRQEWREKKCATYQRKCLFEARAKYFRAF